MNQKNQERMSGAVDQEAFDDAIRENLSPAGVAAIIAFLQPATMNRPTTPEQKQALQEVEWFTNTLIDLLGVDEYNRLLEEISL